MLTPNASLRTLKNMSDNVAQWRKNVQEINGEVLCGKPGSSYPT
jgi:hypothetical protein